MEENIQFVNGKCFDCSWYQFITETTFIVNPSNYSFIMNYLTSTQTFWIRAQNLYKNYLYTFLNSERREKCIGFIMISVCVFFYVSVHFIELKEWSDIKHQGQFFVANWRWLEHSGDYFFEIFLIWNVIWEKPRKNEKMNSTNNFDKIDLCWN